MANILTIGFYEDGVDVLPNINSKISINLTVTDDKTFKRLKWQFMILDEAQAIKNILSQRWNTLKEFQSRNRLLLTGTPIQNNMA